MHERRNSNPLHTSPTSITIQIYTFNTIFFKYIAFQLWPDYYHHRVIYEYDQNLVDHTCLKGIFHTYDDGIITCSNSSFNENKIYKFYHFYHNIKIEILLSSMGLSLTINDNENKNNVLENFCCNNNNNNHLLSNLEQNTYLS